jgi:hypothetical protein
VTGRPLLSPSSALAMAHVKLYGTVNGASCIASRPAAAGGIYRARPTACHLQRQGARAWSSASRGGRAGTMVGKYGHPPRGAHPDPHIGGRTATGDGQLAPERAGIGLRERPDTILRCALRQSEGTALAMGRVVGREGCRCIVRSRFLLNSKQEEGAHELDLQRAWGRT